mmetsp:Transcript_26318/g.26568  ORF Transcript_26318/g.26568 Transcript_26318/m.26568 type:complete len:154 (+) Transcript_26318:118-579(+)
MNSLNRTIDIGLEGFTPTKVYTYRPSDPVSSGIIEYSKRPKTSRAIHEPPPDAFLNYVLPSPSLKGQGNQASNSKSYRPTTSRAKKDPSPDDFTDYVVPSQAISFYQDNSKVYIPEDGFMGKDSCENENFETTLDIHSFEALACFIFASAFKV